jgi:hypothetical protein
MSATNDHLSDLQREFVAYQIRSGVTMLIVPAGVDREWINKLPERFAQRCLPLLMANQSGWLILNTHAFGAVWNGGRNQSDLMIVYRSGPPPFPASSTFGSGILTFHIPYLFRTSPGFNVLVRGPANWPKDAVAALEGLVETDWTDATFTMNWQCTRPGAMVSFEQGEPICMLVPQRRGDLERFQTSTRELRADGALSDGFHQWNLSRERFLMMQRMGHRRYGPGVWQKHYFRGTSPSGARAPQHQTKVHLDRFDTVADNITGEACQPHQDAPGPGPATQGLGSP